MYNNIVYPPLVHRLSVYQHVVHGAHWSNQCLMVILIHKFWQLVHETFLCKNGSLFPKKKRCTTDVKKYKCGMKWIILLVRWVQKIILRIWAISNNIITILKPVELALRFMCMSNKAIIIIIIHIICSQIYFNKTNRNDHFKDLLLWGIYTYGMYSYEH